jgi:hypothetical protein
MMCMMSTKMLATLRTGVCIPYGERCVTESAPQIYLDETHSLFSLIPE